MRQTSHRRRYLASIATSLGLLSGCAGGGEEGTSTTRQQSTPTDTAAETVAESETEAYTQTETQTDTRTPTDPSLQPAFPQPEYGPGATGHAAETAVAMTSYASSDPVWSVDLPDEPSVSVLLSILIANDRVYASAGTGLRRSDDQFTFVVEPGDDAEDVTVYDGSLVGLSPNGETLFRNVDGTLVASDAQTGTESWQTPLGPGVAITDEYVVVGGDSLQAYDRASGEQRWATDSITANTVVAEDDLIATSAGQTLSAVDAADGSRLWENTTKQSGIRFSNVAIDGQVIAVEPAEATLGHVTSFDRDGTQQWDAQFGSSVIGAEAGGFAVSDDQVLVAFERTAAGEGDMIVRALDRGDGSRAWQTPADGGAPVSAWALDDGFYVRGFNGLAYVAGDGSSSAVVRNTTRSNPGAFVFTSDALVMLTTDRVQAFA